MPFEMQTNVSKPNEPHTFIFSDTVTQRLVGISGFKLSFGNDDDHHLQTALINLQVSNSGESVTVVPNARFEDGSGNDIDNDTSSITVVVMAWTGVNDDNLKLGNANGISANNCSQPISIPCTNPESLKAILSGFNFSYGSSGHHVKSIGASLGTQLNGTSANITGECEMGDGSGNSATTATLDGALFANCDPSLNIEIQTIDKLKHGEHKTLHFGENMRNFAGVITAYNVAFEDEDHHVQYFGVTFKVGSVIGTSNPVVIARAFIGDADNHCQDNDTSYVSGFVIGY